MIPRSMVSMVGCWLGVLLAAAVATAQQAPIQPPADLFSQSVEVRVVNVDVFVDDKKGNPVTGLTRDDFVLAVDGREVEIEYFSAFEAGSPTRPLEASAALQAGPAPEPAPAGPESAASREEDDLLLVLYLDNFWLRPADRRRILDDVERFVEEQPPGRRFLVASYDPGLNLRTPVVTDPPLVVATLEEMQSLPAHGIDAEREHRDTYDSIISVWESYRDTPTCEDPCDCAMPEMIELWRRYAENTTHRMRVASGGLRELLAALSGMPGRKAILYVAAGLELRPGFDILQYMTELCPRYQREISTYFLVYDENGTLLEVGANANAGRATLYTLDAGGLRADDTASVEWPTLRMRPSALVTDIERINLQGSMQLLASTTGGEAILNANQPFDALVGLESDFHTVYSLGFTPSWEADGQTHLLKVQLRGRHRGVRLRHRESFVDKPLDQRLIDRAIAAVTFAAESNPLGVEVSLGEPTRLARNQISLPVHVDVPAGSLSLVPGADGKPAGRFRVFLAARSSDGARTLVRQKFFDLTPEAVDEGGMSIVVSMFLEPGDYTVGVGVRDEVGSETSYLALTTPPPAAPSD